MGDDEWEKLPTEDKVVHKVRMFPCMMSFQSFSLRRYPALFVLKLRILNLTISLSLTSCFSTFKFLKLLEKHLIIFYW